MSEQRNSLLNPEFMKVIQLKVNQTPGYSLSLPAIEEVMKALIWAQETLSRDKKARG